MPASRLSDLALFSDQKPEPFVVDDVFWFVRVEMNALVLSVDQFQQVIKDCCSDSAPLKVGMDPKYREVVLASVSDVAECARHLPPDWQQVFWILPVEGSLESRSG